MNIIDTIKLNILYSDLKKLKIDKNKMHQFLSNKNFNSKYKTIIKPFIKYLKNLNLDDDMINHHIIVAMELEDKNNNANKYINFITEVSDPQYKIINFEVFNDNNFEELYSLLRNSIFKENIYKIINAGYSERLIEFIKLNKSIPDDEITLSLFQDKVWNIIKSNPSIGNNRTLELFRNRYDLLANLIEKDLFIGLKYTYENIPESHNFIEYQLGRREEKTFSFQQFSVDFIKKIGDETLKILYNRHKFSDKTEFEKIFEIVSYENYELIHDIINYDTYDFSFKKISSDDMKKQLLETNINNYNKKEVFLNKFFGIKRMDIHYIKLFLNAINKATNIPDEFNEKYGAILQLINQVLISNDEQLIQLSKIIDSNKKEQYKNLIAMCEKEGNDILKRQFVNDLNLRNQKIIDTANHKKIKTDDNQDIDVYELTGQQFTMLVHAISDNSQSINNSFVTQIINNPENWEKIMGGNNHISTSLISDKYMVSYGTPNNNKTMMFGFNKLDWDTIKFTEISDAGIDRNVSTNINYNMRNRFDTPEINTVSTIDDIMEKTIQKNARDTSAAPIWNEILLSRTNQTTNKKIKPNYIVCMDIISENSKKAASYFNIPIYLINTKYYLDYPWIKKNTDNIEIEKTYQLKR